jgi:hypothetical protein
MTENEAIKRILDRCDELGLLAHHDSDSRKVQGTPGFPDVVVAGTDGLMWIEMKEDSFSKISSAQVTWKYTLKSSGQNADIYTTADLPMILDMLEELAC